MISPRQPASRLARLIVATLLLGTALLALHRWLPGRRLTLRSLLPGVIVSTILWLLAASLFSIYVAELGSYSATYGSLGGVIVTLVFFYVSAVLFIFGAELNSALLRRRAGRVGDPALPDNDAARRLARS